MVTTGLSRKRPSGVRDFLGELYGQDLHAERVDALTGATLTGASLAVATIGQALAQARGLVTSMRKQVDRVMSNAHTADVWTRRPA